MKYDEHGILITHRFLEIGDIIEAGDEYDFRYQVGKDSPVDIGRKYNNSYVAMRRKIKYD